MTDHQNHHNLTFEMISLRVQKDELEKIFEDGFSSDYSERLGFAGTGVGMYVIKRLCDLNDFILKFENNVDSSKTKERMGIPFDKNVLTIGIKKRH